MCPVTAGAFTLYVARAPPALYVLSGILFTTYTNDHPNVVTTDPIVATEVRGNRSTIELIIVALRLFIDFDQLAFNARILRSEAHIRQDLIHFSASNMSEKCIFPSKVNIRIIDYVVIFR
jgi:hypothetical protein